MKKNIRNFLVGTGITAGMVTVMGAVSYVITKKLVAVAMDRNETEAVEFSRRTLSEIPEMRAFFALQNGAAEQLKNKDCERVEITAADGIKLVGHLRTCENAERIIIAMHGWRSSWAKDFGFLADFLHDNGCHVLYAEQRGQGSSGGDYIGFGLTERFDCLDWIKWVNEQGYGNLPVYLCGISMGASTVLMAGGSELPGNVHGIIADCGYTSPYAIWKYVTENDLHIYYDDVRRSIADDICREKIQFGSNDYSCTEALTNCKIPVLFIHGTDDSFVPVEMSYENYKACVSPKRLFVVPGAEHGMSYMVDKKGYEQAVKQFWHDFDSREVETDEKGNCI